MIDQALHFLSPPPRLNSLGIRVGGDGTMRDEVLTQVGVLVIQAFELFETPNSDMFDVTRHWLDVAS